MAATRRVTTLGGRDATREFTRLTPTIDQPLHRTLGLTDDEFEQIEDRLARAANDFELAVFSLLWSEHCGYKHSARLLSRFPTSGEHVLQGPGENAGVVSVGDGLAVAFKVESHNHPSAVEPFLLMARQLISLDAGDTDDTAGVNARPRHRHRRILLSIS